MVEQHNPERRAARQLRYTPEGHHAQLDRLATAQMEAMHTARRFVPKVPREIRDAITSAVISGSEVAIDTSNPDVANYRDAVQLAHDRSLEEFEEKNRANRYLEAIAEPLLPDPPQDQWGIVTVEDEKGSSQLRVPFTPDELAAINEVRIARRRLSVTPLQEVDTSALWEASMHFPDEVRETQASPGLTNRRSAVSGIMITARAAEDTLTGPTRPRGEIVGLLTVIRDLPDRLVRHESPTVK